MRRRRALSLAETIVASCLLGMVTLAVCNLLPSSLLAMRRGEQQMRADQIAQELLVGYSSVPFAALTLGPVAPAPAVQKWDGVDYVSTASVFKIAGTDEQLAKGLRVTVRWTFRKKDYQTTQESWRVHVRTP